jgi:dihydroorotase
MTSLIANATIINEGKNDIGHVVIENGKIKDIVYGQNDPKSISHDSYIDAIGKILIPGVIDDQVHFREPGLTRKADIYSESRAAVAGGVTSYMEMPNTIPQTTSQELLEQKFKIAQEKSLANYSFYIGATNDNINELIKTNPKKVCGIKVFMGSSTGNMLVDKPESLELIFSKAPTLVAVHCEDEQIIKNNIEEYKTRFGEDIPLVYHPAIRSEEACYKSSKLAVDLAKKFNTRLHILHVSTEKELELLENTSKLSEKQITAEVCLHHLWFDESDYSKLGTKIKWNPAIKKKSDKEALFKGILDNKIDIIATDHAPHLLEEKNNTYFNAPSGGPLVQHALLAMLEMHLEGRLSIQKIVEKMCHAPSDIFHIDKRGYIKKGYWADLVLIDLKQPTQVLESNIHYKCGWSPFEAYTFHSSIDKTFVNGNLVYDNGTFYEDIKGRALSFNR